MICTKSKPQPSQTPSQSLRRNVLRVVVHNDGTAGESQLTYSGTADCPTAAPYQLLILPKCLVKRYRYTSEYRTTVRETLLISYCQYAAMQPAAMQPCSQQPAASSQPACQLPAVAWYTSSTCHRAQPCRYRSAPRLLASAARCHAGKPSRLGSSE